MSLFQPIKPNIDLNELLERARLMTEMMSPEERSSMYACQMIGYVMSETIMAVHEEGASRDGAKNILNLMVDAIDGDASVYAQIPSIVEKVWCLLPDDKVRMKARILSAMAELNE